MAAERARGAHLVGEDEVLLSGLLLGVQALRDEGPFSPDEGRVAVGGEQRTIALEGLQLGSRIGEVVFGLLEAAPRLRLQGGQVRPGQVLFDAGPQGQDPRGELILRKGGRGGRPAAPEGSPR